ncbi:MAG: DUF541 domain-containing protein [Actinobacteria bacterium]|nr:MAG: DUF541 domain-containing protein [Actinomycetota bacterium]
MSAGTSDDPTVTVRGHATVQVEPDEVQMWVEVSALEATPEKALAEASRRGQLLRDVFEQLQVPPARRVNTGLSIREEHEYERQRNILKGYRAASRVLVRLSDPSVVGRLMTEATARAQARVEGPWWRVAPDNPAWAEARHRAAREARSKAEAYAEALDLRLGPVVAIAEPEIHSGQVHRLPVRFAATSALAEPEPDMPIDAGELEVAAVVDVTFRLENEANGG